MFDAKTYSREYQRNRRKDPVERQKDKDYAKKFRLEHKELTVKRTQDWRNNNPDKVKAYERKHHLESTYGLTEIEYNELFIIQNGRCAICERHQSEFQKALHIDHNHNTNEIRGLLCGECNHILGLAKADEGADLLRKAILYLEKKDAE